MQLQEGAAGRQAGRLSGRRWLPGHAPLDERGPGAGGNEVKQQRGGGYLTIDGEGRRLRDPLGQHALPGWGWDGVGWG